MIFGLSSQSHLKIDFLCQGVFSFYQLIIYIILIFSKNFLIFIILYSVIFVTVPFAINALSAFMILSFEVTQNPEFNEWFKGHSRMAAIIIFFSSGNVEL